RGKGRPKGSKNKFTNIKDAFVNVFQDVGGEKYLKKFALEHPKEFVKLMGGMLPKDIQQEIKHNVVRISWGREGDQIEDAEVITPKIEPPP
ncbi:MAG: hypothetical protein HN344_09720, partial [Gammaproteobacteria bacterium]|nr:hypothetical protein [Gammaproteobacteria bacterium]